MNFKVCKKSTIFLTYMILFIFVKHIFFYALWIINSLEKAINEILFVLKDQCIDTKGKIYLCKGVINNHKNIEKVFIES